MTGKIKFLLLSFFVLLFTNSILAKDGIGQPVHRQIKWGEPVTNNIGKSAVKVLRFEGGFYDINDIPKYIERFPLTNAVSGLSAELSGVQYEVLKEGALIKNAGKIGKDIIIKTELVIEKKNAFVQISFIPIRKNASGSVFEKVVSFDVTISSQPSGAARRMEARYYAPASMLATGTWYKLGVVNDGIYKLTYQNLKDLGINVDGINPQNLRIYGNGGGMLPFANYLPRFDDLQENAIFFQGGNNGKFNPTDYVLFYGEGPTRWQHSASDNHYHHQVNWYSDTTYYFINADMGAGKRIQSQSSTSSSATETVTTFDDYAYHELDAENWLKSGRHWYGEVFDDVNNSFSFQFSFPNHVVSDSIYMQSDVWARSINLSSSFTLSANGGFLLSEGVPPVSDDPFGTFAYPCSSGTSINFISNSDLLNVNLKYNPNLGNPQGQGWLNYLELNVQRSLAMASNAGQLQFRNASITGAGKIAEYSLGGATSSTQVWEITDPLNISNVVPESNAGGIFNFRLPADSIREFISFNGTVYYSPSLTGKIDNQNLHGLAQTDMIIVAHPNFMSAALRLAQFHRDHDKMTVLVVTPQQIYNEYSSGKQDVTAIRDFMKMFYDRSTSSSTLPKYLLLFGRGSYDPKYRTPGNTNYIVCYESDVSNDPTTSYMSDDFFTFLDSTEGDWENGSTNLMDMSVGRLPAKTATEAEAMVDKIIHYATPGTFSNGQICSNGASSSLGDWRNSVAFVCDQGDNDIHFLQSETIDTYVDTNYRDYNIDKMYTDSYKQVATPGGDRFPDCEAAIVQRVQRGALLINYIGHGGPVGWSASRILEVADITGWTNYNVLPAFMTATCEFSTADDPSITSAGELVLLNPQGGGIALFTTCRLAYSEANFELGQKFYTHFFNPIGNRMPRMGEICMLTKNEYSSEQTRNFLLLGDPALTLAYPKWNVTTTTINGSPVTATSIPDTIKALQKVTIGGFVNDGKGKKLSNFNGVIYPTVYDKATTFYTLANNPSVSYVAPFKLQKSILYKGAVSVVNGEFSFTFVVPKDISYQYGFGRLSYYADDQTVDASGYFENFIIGGANSKAVISTKGPSVKLYMNDTTFVYGGLTDQNPSLYARISDSSGVSTVGNGIGHDITAQLDNDNTKIYVLNDYYQADLNSYQSGKVIYAFSGLTDGTHTITFKVWDVYNNSTEARLEFVVSSSTKLELTHVLNYPNPFTTNTRFFFEHNKPCMPFVVLIQIYTVSGKLVKTIRTDTECNGYRSDSIEWDGLDDFGDKIGRGVYVYHLKVHAADGSEADKFEKLVVLR